MLVAALRVLAVPVPSVEHASANPKKITSWMTAVAEATRKNPPSAVLYAKPMPDIERLMQAWPTEFEQLIKTVCTSIACCPFG